MFTVLTVLTVHGRRRGSRANRAGSGIIFTTHSHTYTHIQRAASVRKGELAITSCISLHSSRSSLVGSRGEVEASRGSSSQSSRDHTRATRLVSHTTHMYAMKNLFRTQPSLTTPRFVRPFALASFTDRHRRFSCGNRHHQHIAHIAVSYVAISLLYSLRYALSLCSLAVLSYIAVFPLLPSHDIASQD